MNTQKNTNGCECLCKKHKTELKKLLSGAFLRPNNKEKSNSDAPCQQEVDPVEQKVLKIEAKHPERQACVACIRVYLHLLTSAHGEQTAESYLSSSYQKCCLSTNKK